MVEKPTYINAEEASALVGIAKSHAYKVLRQLNRELAEKGKITFARRVPLSYFKERVM